MAIRVGNKTYKNPAAAARHAEKLREHGAHLEGTRAAMASIGVQPHHYSDETTEGLPEAEAILLARQLARAQPEPDDTWAPTPSSNPRNPRTSGASYYSTTQTMVVEWGDGGTPYAYYDVPMQTWNAFKETDSPGRFINAVLNNYQYGPIAPRYQGTSRRTNW